MSVAVPHVTPLQLDLRATLERFNAPDAEQERLRREFLAHLERHPDAVHRDGPPQHFTASVLVVDRVGADLSRVLLTHHRKARMWLQFGGHLEGTDTSVRAAALREGLEESGLPRLDLRPGLVELDRHELHGDFVHCTHHLDLRFVAVAPEGSEHAVSDESLDVAWWPADRMASPHGEDLPRLISRARALR